MTDSQVVNPARFLGRADAYAAARPGYPAALGAWLEEAGLLSGGVADIGAGTGRGMRHVRPKRRYCRV